jgi:hypothetical protein
MREDRRRLEVWRHREKTEKTGGINVDQLRTRENVMEISVYIGCYMPIKEHGDET